MNIPDDHRALVAARLERLQHTFARLTTGRDSQEQCREAARDLISALQAVLNRLRP